MRFDILLQKFDSKRGLDNCGRLERPSKCKWNPSKYK